MGPCLLCGRGEDSIEHYICCPVTRTFAADRLRLSYEHNEAKQLLLFAAAPPRLSTLNDLWQRAALLLYAVYRTTNAIRHGAAAQGQEVSRALSQALVEATRGHPSSMALLSQIWTRNVRRRTQ